MKTVFLFLMMVSIGAGLHAQQVIVWDNVIMKDSSGKIYPTAVWQSMNASGKYNITIASDGVTGRLAKLSTEEYERRIASLPKPGPSNSFTTGAKMKWFSVTDIDGNKFNLKDLAGKVVVLNFFFINCPPCRQEIPHLNEMMEAYAKNSKVVFIAVALDQKAELKQFLKELPFNYHIIDDGRFMAQENGVTNYPTHVVVGKDGNIAFHTTGLAITTVPWLQKSIDAALQGKTL